MISLGSVASCGLPEKMRMDSHPPHGWFAPPFRRRCELFSRHVEETAHASPPMPVFIRPHGEKRELKFLSPLDDNACTDCVDCEGSVYTPELVAQKT